MPAARNPDRFPGRGRSPRRSPHYELPADAPLDSPMNVVRHPSSAPLGPAWERALMRRIVECRQAMADAEPGSARLETLSRLHQALRGKMVRANLRFVAYIARRFLARGLPIDDLMQAGTIGVIRAIDKFDPAMERPFITYAQTAIRRAMQRATMEGVYPVKLNANYASLVAQIHIGTEPESLNRRETAIRAVVLSETRSIDAANDDGFSLASILVAPEDGRREQAEDSIDLADILGRLDARYRVALSLRFGIGTGQEMDLHDIGDRLGVTSERARQMTEKGLARALVKARDQRTRTGLRLDPASLPLVSAAPVAATPVPEPPPCRAVNVSLPNSLRLVPVKAAVAQDDRRPTPLATWVGRFDDKTFGECTAMVRHWSAGDAAACELCPRDVCTVGASGTCIVVAIGRVGSEDAPLWSAEAEGGDGCSA